MRAILVVDVNRGYGWSSDKNEQGTDGQNFVSNLKTLLERERRNGTKIIFVIWPTGRFSGQEFFVRPSSVFGRCASCKNGEMPDFLDHCHGKDLYEPIFFKNEADAFSNGNLSKYLYKEGITEVVLAGCVTTCCVLYTAIGARAAGFNVVVLKQCVLPPFSSEQNVERWMSVVRNRSASSLSVSAE